MTEWTCKRCGMCCGIVPFEPADYEKAKETGVQFEPQMISGHLCYIPKAALKTGRCPFYNRKKKICTIYKDRPQVCRDFGDGPHPCLICPHNPRHNPEQIKKLRKQNRILRESLAEYFDKWIDANIQAIKDKDQIRVLTEQEQARHQLIIDQLKGLK